MPIIFPFTQTGTAIATILFFVCFIYCGFTAMYLEGEKYKNYPKLKFSLIFAAILLIYCEYCAVNIGFTLNPPKKTNIQCLDK